MTHGVSFKAYRNLDLTNLKGNKVMGQKTSCLGEERKSYPHTSGSPSNSQQRQQYSYQPVSAPIHKTAAQFGNESEPNEIFNKKLVKGNLIRTRTTESDDEDDDQQDRKSGYILVDLKGDKVVHIDQDYLVGCEVTT